MPKYRLSKDVLIPAGTKVTSEPPHKTQTYTDTAQIHVEVTPDVTATWYMDLEEAITEGVVERVDTVEGEEDDDED